MHVFHQRGEENQHSPFHNYVLLQPTFPISQNPSVHLFTINRIVQKFQHSFQTIVAQTYISQCNCVINHLPSSHATTHDLLNAYSLSFVILVVCMFDKQNQTLFYLYV